MDKDRWNELRSKIKGYAEKIKRHGYILKDIQRRNTYYDEYTGRIYFIDFHQIERAGD